MPASKDSASEKIMASAELKQLLAKSKKEPLSAAIALTNDEEGIILLDKKKKPKGVRSLLIKEAAKNKVGLNKQSIRFGRAEVDTDYDAGMVRFFIDKEAPGKMRQKLVEVVKQISYSKVELNIDLDLEAEPEEEEEDDGQAEWGGAPGEVEPPPPPPQPTADPLLNVDFLTKELGGLIRRIPEAARAGAEVMDKLKKLATLANTNIKTSNLKIASGLIAELRKELGEALDGLGAGIGQVAPTQPTDSYGKARAAWQGVRTQFITHVGQLHAKLTETYKGSPLEKEIDTQFNQRVLAKVAQLDDGLITLLGEASGAADPDLRAAKVKAAQEKIAAHREFVSQEKKLLEDIDDNPFVPGSYLPVLTKTLDTLAAAVR